MKKNKRAKWIGLAAMLLVVLADQLTKYFAITYLKPVGKAPFIPGILHFQWVTNYGAAWGNFAGNQWILLGLTGVLVVVLILAVFCGWIKDVPLSILFLLFAGGGIGNLIDRLRFGYVVDFLKFSFFEFPVFNVADSVITVCAVITFVYVFFIQGRKTKKAKKAAETAEETPADGADHEA